MTICEPVLEEKLHYYPLLLDYAFEFHEGKFDPKGLLSLVGEYTKRHIQKDLAKKGGNANEVLESFIKKLTDEYDSKSQLNAVGVLLSNADKLEHGEEARFPISMTNVTLRLKRFGDCLGIRATDGRDSEHESATEIFKGMTLESPYFRPFVYSHSITMPRWQAYGNGSSINVLAELDSAARYIPDVEWRIDATVVTDALLEDYIETSHQNGDNGRGVEVGRYHDIPVHMQILFGGKDNDRTWRKGSVSRLLNNACTLEFDALTYNQSDGLRLKYFMQIADENNMFKPATPEINYRTEQQCHQYLAKTLLDAFSARDLAETIARNSHWVKWREPDKPQAQ